MGWFEIGKSDSQHSKGQAGLIKKTWQEKEKYVAGYTKGKDQAQKKK